MAAGTLERQRPVAERYVYEVLRRAPRSACGTAIRDVRSGGPTMGWCGWRLYWGRERHVYVHTLRHNEVE